MRSHHSLSISAMLIWVVLVSTSQVGSAQEAESTRGDADNASSQHTRVLRWENGTTLELVWIPPGTFRMGSEDGDPDERPVHDVKFLKGFWMGTTEVTQRQFETATGYNPSRFLDPEYPVETVNMLEDVNTFLKGLVRSGVLPDGFIPRLPTEAEWEYACRAGSTSAFSFGSEQGALNAHAWFVENGGGSTHEVGQKSPNSFGLYDMHGNVWEWCSDWYMETFYQVNEQEVAPIGPSAGGARVLRGGSWDNTASYCRSANRFRFRPWSKDDSVGIRLVLHER